MRHFVQNFFLSHTTDQGVHTWSVIHTVIRKAGSFLGGSVVSTRALAWSLIGRSTWRRRHACPLEPRAWSADVIGNSCSQDQTQLPEVSSSHVPRHSPIILERNSEFGEQLAASALGFVFDPQKNYRSRRNPSFPPVHFPDEETQIEFKGLPFSLRSLDV